MCGDGRLGHPRRFEQLHRLNELLHRVVAVHAHLIAEAGPTFRELFQ
jgi:hypothetical protein